MALAAALISYFKTAFAANINPAPAPEKLNFYTRFYHVYVDK